MNKDFEEEYSIQSFTRKAVGIAVATVAITALTGLGLSFTVLCPLMIGVALGGALSASIMAVAIGLRCYFREEINNKKKREGIPEGRIITALMPFFITTALTSVAAGVGLAVTANAIFPGVMLGMESAALAGGIIGAIALPVAVITGIIVTGMFMGNLAEYITQDSLKHDSYNLPNQKQYRCFNESDQDLSEGEEGHDVLSSYTCGAGFSPSRADKFTSHSYKYGSQY